LKNRYYHRLLKVLVLTLLAACANPGTPTGGPKDVTPPKVKRSIPAANALNYKEKEITIEFDEMIKLKDVSQKLVISPPVNKQPKVVERGNKVVVTFEEDLQDNTTYTLDFADAITDNNEGNKLENFRFSFSTGLVVDSMSISGNLFDAKDLSPISDALVFIHNNLADSAFQTLVPVRLSKTDDKGRFSIQNVAPGNYRLYALEDANRDYKYDQPGERIAWLDSIVVPAFEYREKTDSIKPDSVVTRQVLTYIPDSIRLFMFEKPAQVQYRLGDSRKEKARLNLFFQRPVEQFAITPITKDTVPNDWSILESSAKHDSLAIWLTHKEMIDNDSLVFRVDYQMVDSLQQPFIKQDTVTFYYFEVAAKEKKKKKKDEVVETPSMTLAPISASIDMFSNQVITLPAAPLEYHLDSIKVVQKVDSVITPITFTITHDTLNIRRFVVNYRWEPGAKYEMTIDSAAFRDVYGLTNKKMVTPFSIKALDSYGTIYLTLTNAPQNSLVQIVNTKDEVYRQAVLPKNGKLALKYLRPGDYMIRVVSDNNGNKRWDGGDYSTKTQPEAMCYYPEKITLRANWEHEVKWDAATFNLTEFVKKFRKAQKKKTQQ
jgi:uncharacterized protein (DUF2141 family)